MSKQGLFDKSLTNLLSQALAARDVFLSPSRLASEKEQEDYALLALRAQVHLSRSPTLSTLQLLLAEELVQKTLSEYAGVWLSSLSVVIAPKPVILQLSSNKSPISVNHNNDTKIDLSHSNSPRASLSRLSPTHAIFEGPESLTLSAANLLTTLPPVDGFNYYGDLSRVEENQLREKYLKDLLGFRLDELRCADELASLDALSDFCEDPMDANRLLYEYAKERYNLVQSLNQNNVDASLQMKQLEELQLSYKRKAFAASQSFKQIRSKAELLEKELIDKTVTWCKDHFDPTRRTQKLNQALGNEDGTLNSLRNVFPTLIYRADNLAELEVVEMAKLSALEEALRREREQLQMDIEQRSSARMAQRKEITAADLAKKAGRRKDKLVDLDNTLNKGFKALYTKYIDSMANAAQATLAKIDHGFVHGNILDHGDRDDMLEQVLWDVNERKWLLETTDKMQKHLIEGLIFNADEKLRVANKSIFKYELERIETLNAYNAAHR